MFKIALSSKKIDDLPEDDVLYLCSFRAESELYFLYTNKRWWDRFWEKGDAGKEPALFIAELESLEANFTQLCQFLDMWFGVSSTMVLTEKQSGQMADCLRYFRGEFFLEDLASEEVSGLKWVQALAIFGLDAFLHVGILSDEEEELAKGNKEEEPINLEQGGNN